MGWRKYNITELANILNVSSEDFHRKIKKSIILDFKDELRVSRIDNPDIHLNEENLIKLVHPRDNNNFIETEVNINDYIE